MDECWQHHWRQIIHGTVSVDYEQSLFPLRYSWEKANKWAIMKIACRVVWRTCRATCVDSEPERLTALAAWHVRHAMRKGRLLVVYVVGMSSTRECACKNCTCIVLFTLEVRKRGTTKQLVIRTKILVITGFTWYQLKIVKPLGQSWKERKLSTSNGL